MKPKQYPDHTVRDLLATDYVTPATREALLDRLNQPPGEPRFFDPQAFAVLRAACERLVPQPGRATPIDLAGAIDARLAASQGDGWRFDQMPPDDRAYVRGLRALDELARSRFDAAFAALDGPRQDELLAAVQRGEVAGDAWQDLPANRFFEELLVDACETYFSHPLAQEEIGYVGMADAHGWQALGLEQLDPHEPVSQGGRRE